MKTPAFNPAPRTGQAFNSRCCVPPYRPSKSVGKHQSPGQYDVLQIRSHGCGQTEKIPSIQRLANDSNMAREAGTHSAQCPSSANQMLISNQPNFRRFSMKTLTIKDLARTEQLDRTAMAAVRGGMKVKSSSNSFGDLTFAPNWDSSIHATQDLFQMQDVVNATANGSAFLDNIHVDNRVSQDGTNKIIRK
jgi:hypothetical protein